MKISDELVDRVARAIAFDDPNDSLDFFPDEEQQIFRDQAVRILSATFDWQPIESAPKDGTEVLGRVEGGVCNLFFDTAQGQWNCNKQPTHWLPMIPLPEVKRD